MYPLLRRHELSSEWLQTFPVWGSFDEDDSEMVRPVVDDDPFAADCDPLTIKSEFQTVEGIRLSGCICLERAFDTIYLVEVFLNQTWFGFNRHLKDLAAEDLEKLKSALGDPNLQVFPVRYETKIGRPARDLAGTFTPFGAEEGTQGPPQSCKNA
jgi:hypothetical protein